ncbi:MAG: Lrp/AsnC family transcriptional regulator [Acidimicrobiales bacterium]|jgi:Lrp/AsnC family transcriptional regulator|nr:Lrp/AsnC family transcriptional regulator [Acidimicrobiales bacterium]
MDHIDKTIIDLLQHNAGLSAREIAAEVNLTPTPCWRRIQRLENEGIIVGKVALINPKDVNLSVSALVQIRTNRHSADWMDQFTKALKKFPEIIEAYRTSGEVDYMLRVFVPDMEAYDLFYKRLIEEVDLYDVSTNFIMEEMKKTTALPLNYC